jgi:acyl carrier protein
MSAQLQQEIATFIREEVLRGRAVELTAETSLLELGIIESLSLAALIRHLETRYGARIEDEDLLPANFRDLGAIARLVEKRTAA